MKGFRPVALRPTLSDGLPLSSGFCVGLQIADRGETLSSRHAVANKGVPLAALYRPAPEKGQIFSASFKSSVI
jgi:hypothetical protein